MSNLICRLKKNYTDNWNIFALKLMYIKYFSANQSVIVWIFQVENDLDKGGKEERVLFQNQIQCDVQVSKVTICQKTSKKIGFSIYNYNFKKFILKVMNINS